MLPIFLFVRKGCTVGIDGWDVITFCWGIVLGAYDECERLHDGRRETFPLGRCSQC